MRCFWEKLIKISHIHISSKVINGFKRGSKELGLPTANLEITPQINEKIQNLLSGVYIGEIKFEKFNSLSMKCVLSIGYNPFYENRNKTIEVYILATFINNFYGEVVDLTITDFIRVESDFKEFSFLINYLNNDVYSANYSMKLNGCWKIIILQFPYIADFINLCRSSGRRCCNCIPLLWRLDVCRCSACWRRESATVLWSCHWVFLTTAPRSEKRRKSWSWTFWRSVHRWFC